MIKAILVLMILSFLILCFLGPVIDWMDRRVEKCAQNKADNINKE